MKLQVMARLAGCEAKAVQAAWHTDDDDSIRSRNRIRKLWALGIIPRLIGLAIGAEKFERVKGGRDVHMRVL